MAALVIRFPRTATKTRLIAFALSVLVIDVLCRISFYSIVDWILWELPPRYILGANVLTVVIVSTLLTVWLPPAIGSALGSKLTRLPALRFWPKMTGIPAVARELKPPFRPTSEAWGGGPWAGRRSASGWTKMPANDLRS